MDSRESVWTRETIITHVTRNTIEASKMNTPGTHAILIRSSCSTTVNERWDGGRSKALRSIQLQGN